MSNNAGRIVVGANGTVYVGATTATPPTNATSPLPVTTVHAQTPSSYVTLGFVSEAGITVIPSQTVSPIMA